MRKLSRFITIFILLFSASWAGAVDFDQPPPCHALSAVDGKYRLGLIGPSDNPELEVRLWELGMFYKDVAVCQEPWDRITPQWTPQAKVAEMEKYFGFVAYAVAFVLCLLLIPLLPAAWTRHITLLGLAGLTFSTWAMGTGMIYLINLSHFPRNYLYAEVVLIQAGDGAEQWLEVNGVWELDRALMARGLKPDFTRLKLRPGSVDDSIVLWLDPGRIPVKKTQPLEEELVPTGEIKEVDGKRFVELKKEPKQQEGVESVTATDIDPLILWIDMYDLLSLDFSGEDPVGQTYKVRNPLNIRENPGTQHARLDIGTLHKGTRVSVIATHGDWWKVKVASLDTEGWVSSLWLRRIEE